MNGNCHFIFGATLGSVLALNLDKIETTLPNICSSPDTACLFVLGGIVGGIFPDIDNPGSYMGKMSVPVSNFISKIGEGFGKTGYNHRGILHDPTLYIICLYLSYFYFPSLTGFFIGCLSHLFLDSFNPKGIPFILLRRNRLSLAKIPSGSKESIIFTWVNVLLVLAVGISIKFF